MRPEKELAGSSENDEPIGEGEEIIEEDSLPEDQTTEQVAALSGAAAKVLWTDVTPALVNDPQASREAAEVAKGLGPDIQVIINRPLSLGGDNFAEYLLRVPGCYAYLGTSNPQRPDTQISLHNGFFDLDEDALVLGASLYAGYANWWLTGRETT